MKPNCPILQTTSQDLPLIFELFDQSVAYQEKHGYPAWRNYDKGAIERDMVSGNQYKVMVDDVLGIVFSVAYSDKIIWREMDKGSAIYLHRIVVNPACKGQKLFGKVMDWAVEHAGQKQLCFVRLDTWAANTNLVNYYIGFGFRFVENYTTPDTTELPVHNRNLGLTLLEFKV